MIFFVRFDELIYKLGIDRFVDEDARARNTALARIEKDPAHGAGDRLIEIRILENDVGGFSAQFKVTFLQLLPANARILLPTLVEPVKLIFPTSLWPAMASPTVAPCPVTMFTTPGGRFTS